MQSASKALQALHQLEFPTKKTPPASLPYVQHMSRFFLSLGLNANPSAAGLSKINSKILIMNAVSPDH